MPQIGVYNPKIDYLQNWPTLNILALLKKSVKIKGLFVWGNGIFLGGGGG